MKHFLGPVKTLRSGRGFTLVELMVVVAIVGILAAMAAYLSDQQNRRRVVSNATLVASRAFREARGHAFATGQPVTILPLTDRLEVFRWSDANNDHKVDWPAEATVRFGTYNITQQRYGGGSYDFAKVVWTSPGGAPSGCNGGANAFGVDANTVMFVPSGQLLGTDFLPCTFDLFVSGQPDVPQVGQVRVGPGGKVDLYEYLQ